MVLGTVTGTAAMTLLQMRILRRDLGGIEGRATLSAVVRMLVAAAALAGATYGVWYGLDSALGRSLAAQIASLVTAIVAGVVVYAVAVLALDVREAGQIRRIVAERLRRSS